MKPFFENGGAMLETRKRDHGEESQETEQANAKRQRSAGPDGFPVIDVASAPLALPGMRRQTPVKERSSIFATRRLPFIPGPYNGGGMEGAHDNSRPRSPSSRAREEAASALGLLVLWPQHVVAAADGYPTPTSEPPQQFAPLANAPPQPAPPAHALPQTMQLPPPCVPLQGFGLPLPPPSPLPLLQTPLMAPMVYADAPKPVPLGEDDLGGGNSASGGGGGGGNVSSDDGFSSGSGSTAGKQRAGTSGSLRSRRPPPKRQRKSQATGLIKTKWSQEDDDRLKDLVAQTEPSAGFKGKRWTFIAEHFFGRTDQQCMQHWNNVLSPCCIKGRGSWTREEDEQVVRLVERHGRKWSTIAQYVPGRVGKQIRERYLNHLDPNINKGPWTLEEEQVLIKARAVHGNQWTAIQKMLPGRSDNDIKNRWNTQLQRRMRKGPVPAPGAIEAAIDQAAQRGLAVRHGDKLLTVSSSTGSDDAGASAAPAASIFEFAGPNGALGNFSTFPSPNGASQDASLAANYEFDAGAAAAAAAALGDPSRDAELQEQL